MPVSHIPRTLGRDDVHIVRTLDGSDTLYSRALATTYHSIKGAVSESRHVFVQSGLNCLRDRASIRILEFGFGTGLNALLALIFSGKHDKEVFYTGIELFPIDFLTASQLNYTEYLLASRDRELYLQMHTTDEFTSGNYHFLKFTDLNDAIVSSGYDIVFFDAFSPEVQPEWWTSDVFQLLFELLDTEGILVTYCAQGEVRRRMSLAGFNVERIPGAPGKRHMLRGIKRSALS